MASAGRPRNPEIEPRVRAATLALLEREGYSSLRVDEVARVSGVAKTTIYRRWASLPLLVLDAVETAVGVRELTESDDVWADLKRLVEVVHSSLVDNPLGAAILAIGPELVREPDLAQEYRRRIVDPLRGQAIEAVRRGQTSGAFATRADPSLLVDAVIGALTYRNMIGEPLPTSADLVELARLLLQPGSTTSNAST